MKIVYVLLTSILLLHNYTTAASNLNDLAEFCESPADTTTKLLCTQVDFERLNITEFDAEQRNKFIDRSRYSYLIKFDGCKFSNGKLPAKFFETLRGPQGRIIHITHSNLVQWHNKIDGDGNDDIQPSRIPLDRTIVELSFANNKIEHFAAGILNRFPSLLILDVSFNRIDRLAEYNFGNISQFYSVIRQNNFPIQKLLLKNNLIETIEPNAFDSMANLNLIDLSHNRLRTVELHSFAKLSMLMKLHLTYNLIETIEPNAFDSTANLNRIDLSNNRLRTVAMHSFAKLRMLKELNLTYNLIETIEPNAFDSMASLNLIDLSHNRLRTIEVHSFAKLSMLMKLHLTYNLIETIEPNAFDSTANLNRIDLSHNRLRTVEMHSFAKLRMLKELNLTYNLIETIEPNAFDSMASLNLIDLSHNRLRTIEVHSFAKLSMLMKLHLTYNLIETIEPNAFDSMANLNRIDLSHNRLRTVEMHSFAKLRMLKELNLTYNLIETIEPNAFDSMASLNLIDLSHNRLRTIEVHSFAKLSTLKQLYLTHNRIKHINADAFRNAKHFSIVELSHNNIEYLQLNELRTDVLQIQNSNLKHINLSSDLLSINKLLLSNNSINDLGGTGSALQIFLSLLDVSHNPIESIQPNALRLPSLHHLNLSDTNLRAFDYNTFAYLSKLQILDLSHNNLKAINEYGLYPLKSLRTLLLDSNNLTAFDYEYLRLGHSTLDLGLTKNRWSCAFLKKMIKFLNQKSFNYLLPPNHKPVGDGNIAGIGCFDTNTESAIKQKQAFDEPPYMTECRAQQTTNNMLLAILLCLCLNVALLCIIGKWIRQKLSHSTQTKTQYNDYTKCSAP